MTDKSAIEKMVEYLDNLTAEEWGRQQTPHRIYNEARRLAAEEKSKPAPCEPDGYEKWLESEIGNDVYEKGYRTFLLRARAMYRASKPVPVEAIEGLTEYDKGEMALDQHLAPVEAKATAEGSLVEYPCPTCGAERFKTERRMNGDSWCRYGHKHPTKDFVRPASPAVEELVRELRSAIKNCRWHDEITEVVGNILAKYDKGGK